MPFLSTLFSKKKNSRQANQSGALLMAEGECLLLAQFAHSAQEPRAACRRCGGCRQVYENRQTQRPRKLRQRKMQKGKD